MQDVVLATRGERAWAHFDGRWRKLSGYYMKREREPYEMDPRGQAFRHIELLPPTFSLDVDLSWPEIGHTFQGPGPVEWHSRAPGRVVAVFHNARKVAPR